MCHSQLIAVGTAAHHDDVGVGKIERLAHADLVHARGNAAPGAAALEGDDVAAVAIEVEGIGIQIDDAQRARKLDRRNIGGDGAAIGACYGAGGNRARIGVFKSVELFDQRRECRVIGDGVEGVIGCLICHGADRLLDIRDDGGVDAGVLQAHLHVVRARTPGKGDKPWGIGDALEVDVVDPRDIVAVGVVVIQEEGAEPAACRFNGLDLAIEAYGIFGQVCLDGTAGNLPAAHASAGGDVGIERGLQMRCVHAQLARRKEGGGNVVDHVQAVVARGDVRCGRFCLGSKGQVKAVAVAAELNACHATDQRGATPTARRTMIGAELAVLHIVVLQRRVALRAKTRVANAIGLGARGAVDAKGDAHIGDACGDRGAERVVGVIDERRCRRKLQRVGYDVLGVVDLAVAVQLVAEQVEQHKVGRLELGQDAHRVELVALKDAYALAAGGTLKIAAALEQGTHHARLHVVAGAVAYHGGAAGGNGVGDEVGGGGLTVGAGDHHAAVDKAREVA